MKKCLICSTPVKWIKFKCADGNVCKQCYEKVSANFTQTIKTKTKEELLAMLKDAQSEPAGTSFEISRKINQLIFFDDKNQQICLPNHKKYTKENLKPEIYSFTEISNCQVVEEQIERLVKKKQQQLGSIKVVLSLENETREIWLIPNYINRDSMAYKTMRSLAANIVAEIKQSKEDVAC
ncbi:DUF4428 domain-containing protein [Enterococcus sp. AZ196]|uniref:DUF4428 domain-containing protein n=1 Tax=Enterococcus sp. AZ196 TaxID=2774659 RepID=UPI003D2B93AB